MPRSFSQKNIRTSTAYCFACSKAQNTIIVLCQGASLKKLSTNNGLLPVRPVQKMREGDESANIKVWYQNKIRTVAQ